MSFFVWQMVPMREKINHQLWTHSLINRTNRTCVMVSRALLNTSGTRFNENCLDRLIVKNYFRFINTVRTKFLPLSFFFSLCSRKKNEVNREVFPSFFLPSFSDVHWMCSDRETSQLCVQQRTIYVSNLRIDHEWRGANRNLLYMFDQREHFN